MFCFFVIQLALNKLNISTITKILFLLYNQSLKTFSKKILKVFKLLSIIARTNSKKVLSAS